MSERKLTHQTSEAGMVSQDNDPYGSIGYQWFVLAILTVVYMFNFIDRQLLVILQEAVKADLALSDAQLGLMSGFAFAALYVLAGLPIARWADRGNRKNIIALSLGVWSLMTVACGYAQNFVQMLLARMGVAVGEAGGTPPALSVISDVFPPERRPFAISIYTSGVYFGLLVGFVLGGWVGQAYGWKIAFISVGAPGVLFAALMVVLVREPERGALDDTSVPSNEDLSISRTVRVLFKNQVFLYTAAAGATASFSSYGVGNWIPSYFLRTFEISMAELGFWLGLSAGLGGIFGTIFGGWFVGRLVRSDSRWYAWFPLLAICANAVLAVTALSTRDLYMAIALATAAGAANAAWLPAVLALVNNLFAANLRTQVTAVFFFLVNIIGLGLGPTIVGIISDAVGFESDADSIRIAMFCAIAFGLSCAAFSLYNAGRLLRTTPLN